MKKIRTQEQIQRYWQKRGFLMVNTHQFSDRNFGWRYPDGTIHLELPTIGG